MSALLDIAKLSPQQRIELIGELCESLSPGDIVLSPAQDAELARRMSTFEADVKEALPWSSVEVHLNSKP